MGAQGVRTRSSRQRPRLLGAAGVVAASARVASVSVPEWDAGLFRRINQLPDWLAPVVWAPMQSGALGAPILAGAWVYARGHRRTGVRLAVGGASAWGAAKVLKRLVNRQRPGHFDPSTVLRIGSADHGLGYPSGHAAVAATIMVAAGAAPRPLSVGVGLVAVMTGVARIYVGAHYPLDVVGGWALGIVVGDAVACVIDALAPVATSQQPNRRS